MKQYAAIDDTVYFWFAGNDTSGSGGDGASPGADVRLAGAAADAAPVYSPTPVLLSNVNYPAGAYEIAIVASAANGFAADNTYAVFCTLAVDGQNPTGIVGSFDTMATTPVIAATSAQLVDDMWDELLTGAAHNDATSAGRRLRELGAFLITEGTAQAGTAYGITLAAGESASDHLFNRNLIVILAGTGAGQTRTIVDYNGTTKVAVVDRDWWVNPDATSEYSIIPDDTPLVADHGVATAGSNNTITIRADASAISSTYAGSIIQIMAGLGAGQSQVIESYNGATKVVTTCCNWTTNPDATSVYAIMPYGVSQTCKLTAGALAEVVAAIIAGIADGSYDLQEMQRIMFAVLTGKSAGGGTATLTFRDPADSKNRVSETVDGDGNRTAVTRDGS